MLSLKVWVLCGLFAWVGVVSAATFTYKPLTYHYIDCDSKRLSFIFPFVESDDNVLSARINNYLHLLFLNLAPPDEYKATPTELAANSWISGGMREIKPKELVLGNAGRVLTVVVFSDSCAAFKSAGETSYAFDARTGRLLFSDDLLTPNGATKLGRHLFRERQAKIRREIRHLKELLSSRKNTSDLGRVNSSIELYEKCLGDRFNANALKSGSETLGAGILGDGYIMFVMGSCSSQSDAALDDLGDLDNKISAEKLRPYLSSYGKYILLGEGDGSMAAISPYGQVFRGKINGIIPVTLYLASDYPLISNVREKGAKYYYDKYRTVIKLSVERRGDLFELTETDSKETPKPALSLKIKDDKLVGQWRGGGRIYSFVAAP